MVVTLDAQLPVARNTNLLPCRRGTLPSHPGLKGVAPSDVETFTLEQRGGAAYEPPEKDHAEHHQATSTSMQLATSVEGAQNREGKAWEQTLNTKPTSRSQATLASYHRALDSASKKGTTPAAASGDGEGKGARGGGGRGIRVSPPDCPRGGDTRGLVGGRLTKSVPLIILFVTHWQQG
jgi:hypothetical protein